MGQGAGDEIEFYFAQAGRGTSTLELACGAGRLTVSLAEWGNRHQHGDATGSGECSSGRAGRVGE